MVPCDSLLRAAAGALRAWGEVQASPKMAPFDAETRGLGQFSEKGWGASSKTASSAS